MTKHRSPWWINLLYALAHNSLSIALVIMLFVIAYIRYAGD